MASPQETPDYSRLHAPQPVIEACYYEFTDWVQEHGVDVSAQYLAVQERQRHMALVVATLLREPEFLDCVAEGDEDEALIQAVETLREQTGNEEYQREFAPHYEAIIADVGETRAWEYTFSDNKSVIHIAGPRLEQLGPIGAIDLLYVNNEARTSKRDKSTLRVNYTFARPEVAEAVDYALYFTEDRQRKWLGTICSHRAFDVKSSPKIAEIVTRSGTNKDIKIRNFELAMLKMLIDSRD